LPTSEGLTLSGVGWAPPEPPDDEPDCDDTGDDSETGCELAGSALELAPEPETDNCAPAGRIPAASRPLTAASWSTVVPYCAAIADSVSPGWTVYPPPPLPSPRLLDDELVADSLAVGSDPDDEADD
jgi:hypothetical protein